MAGWAVDWDISCNGSGNRSEECIVFSNFILGGFNSFSWCFCVRAEDKSCGMWAGRWGRCKSISSIILFNQAMFAMMFVMWLCIVSVSSSFFLECVVLGAQKELLHPLVVSIQLWMSHGREGGTDTLLKSMELGCLGKATYFKRQQPFPSQGAEAVCIHGGAGVLLRWATVLLVSSRKTKKYKMLFLYVT